MKASPHEKNIVKDSFISGKDSGKKKSAFKASKYLSTWVQDFFISNNFKGGVVV